MSAVQAIASKVKAYGMRVISPSHFDPTTMVDVTEDVTGVPPVGENIVIDGNTTTLQDMGVYGDVTAIETSGTFNTDPTYGVSWGIEDWGGTTTEFVIQGSKISELTIEWSGPLTTPSGLALIYFDYLESDGVTVVRNSNINDSWVDDWRGQTYVKDGVTIFAEQETEVLNDRFTVVLPDVKEIRFNIYFLAGYAHTPRWINYLSYTDENQMIVMPYYS